MMSGVPVVSIVGKSGSGKTTFLEKLLPELKRRGYRVATVKHDIHGFDIDHPGKDTWRHAQAGADAVIISSPHRIALIQRRDGEMPLDEIATFVRDVDLIITEGYKRGDKPKIEVCRRARSTELICNPDELIAIVSDQSFSLKVPQFGLEDAAGVASLLEQEFLR
ncbi:MAG: molybdopterin-guanine dinucleotide biosynthesis protein B [Chloroflexota bacterium]